MKKFLAMLLALCMILSSMTIVAFAEEEEEKVEAQKIRVDADLQGTGDYVATPEGGLLQMVKPAGKYGIGAMQWNWYAGVNEETDEPITFDISTMEYMEVEVYLSHPDYFIDKVFEMELTSDGDPDGAEHSNIKSWNTYTEGGTLVKGWNTIKMPMSDFGGSCDLTKFNYIRWFNRADQSGDIVIEEGDMVDFMIGKVAFGTEAEGDKIVLAKDEGTWGGVSYADYAGTRTTTLPAGSVNANFIVHTNKLEEALDLSNFKYVDMYMKVINAEDAAKIKYIVELCAGGTCDAQERCFTGYLTGITDGWCTVRIPLSAFTETTGGGNDLTAINFIRCYAASGNIENDVTIEFAYFQFGDAATTNWVEYDVTPGESTDDMVLVNNTGSKHDGGFYFMDNASEMVYKLNMEPIVPSYVYLVMNLAGRDASVQVGIKNNEDDYVEVYGEERNLPQAAGISKYIIPLNDYIATGKYISAGCVLYIRVGDYGGEAGAGGQVSYNAPMKVVVGYSDFEPEEGVYVPTEDDIKADEEEATATEHRIPIFGCNVEYPSFKLDYENEQAGASCLTYTFGIWDETDKDGKTKEVKNNGFVLGQKFETFCGEEFIDASTMDTFEFDFYVSDAKKFQALTFGDTGIELTSSGQNDNEETNWNVASMISMGIEGGLKDGWNHVRLDLANPGGRTGETDWTNLNYMRLFMVNCSNTPVGKENSVTIKYDNFCLTDYKAQQIELEKPAAEAMAQKIWDAFKDVPEFKKKEVTDEILAAYAANHEAWLAKYTELKAEFDALSSIAQGLVADTKMEGADDNCKKMLTNVEKWVDNYKDYLEDQAEQPDDGGNTDGGNTDGGNTDGGNTDGGNTDGGNTDGGNTDGGNTDGGNTEKKGCGSALTVGAGAMMLLAAAWVTMAARKKED